MMKTRFNVVYLILAFSCLFVAAPQASAQQVQIGTGSPQGVYYHVGRAMCRIMTQMDPVDGLNCKVQATSGSSSNLKAVRAGQIQVGLAQSDVQALAVSGTKAFAPAGPDTSLRSLFSIHSEPFTLVVRKDSGIRALADLAGRRVNIGNPGSGQRGTMEAVMRAMDWTKKDFSLVTQLSASEHAFALCNDLVEAIVYTVGHPNPSVAKATGLCNAQIVEVSGPEIDQMIADAPAYSVAEIPGGIYSANPDAIKTFGVIGTVVVSADMDEETAYQIVAHVFDNLDMFRAAHPALGSLDMAEMTTAGLTAPLHPGARRYFREHGIPDIAVGQ